MSLRIAGSTNETCFKMPVIYKPIFESFQSERLGGVGQSFVMCDWLTLQNIQTRFRNSLVFSVVHADSLLSARYHTRTTSVLLSLQVTGCGLSPR